MPFVFHLKLLEDFRKMLLRFNMWLNDEIPTFERLNYEHTTRCSR